ncbi:lipocalin-like domain-containing protein [soil metagenome]
MKIRQLIILLTVIAVAACNVDKSKTTESGKQLNLAGTWRLIEYEDYDSVNNKWTHPYGDHPKGYFTYTTSGIVNLNGSAEKPLIISADSEYTKPLTLGAVLDNAFGYFGTYTIDSVNSVVTHHVKGGSVINYIGTDQHRQFIINGDTLLLGDPTFKVGKRVLIREE